MDVNFVMKLTGAKKIIYKQRYDSEIAKGNAPEYADLVAKEKIKALDEVMKVSIKR